MKTKAYPKYKPSGVEWLGDVPEHWEVWKIAHGFKLIGSGTTPPSDELEWYDGSIPWITTSELRESVICSTEKTVTKEATLKFSALKIFPKGSLAIAMYGATIGRLGIFGIDASTNQACCVMHGGQVFSIPFVYFWMQAFKESIILLASGGGQPNISQDKIKSIKIPCPSIPEQQAIAVFLDHETGRIDALISKKKKLLSLLAEQRTALISRAVTKGLNPSVKLKPSGAEWLGDVPEHWEVKKLKWAYQSIRSGDGISPDDIEPMGIYPVYGGNGIMGYTEKFNSKHEDIIIGRVGAKCGNVYLIDGPKWISDNALKLNIHKVSRRYLALVLEERNINQLANQNAQPLITGSMVGNQFITFPPLSEQQAIAAFLDRETAKIDALSAKVQTAIERLKEYRTALISAAVTGKLDVREEVG